MQGLQKVPGPNAQPKLEGHAHAIELIHLATIQQPQIIVLGTGSGKSLLFFSVAAMVSYQTVIVVVPFAALVDEWHKNGLHFIVRPWSRRNGNVQSQRNRVAYLSNIY